MAFIQETHFQSTRIQKLHKHSFPQVFHATCPTLKTKGVSTLFSRPFPFKLEDTLDDPDRRFLFLKRTGEGEKFTFANIYCPNVGHAAFLQKVCGRLHQFASGTVILGGDFNVPLAPIIDSSTGNSSIPFKAL